MTRCPSPPRDPDWLTEDDCGLDDFRRLVEQHTDPADYPHADARRAGRAGLRQRRGCAPRRRPTDGARCRPSWSGRCRRPRHRGRSTARSPTSAVVDRATGGFEELIARAARRRAAPRATTSPSRAPTTGSGTRWRSSPCAHPEVFADYYANDMHRRWSRQAWLGPGYQVTSQVNVVNPGGAAQSVHRDYHLGFLHARRRPRAYPAHVHRLSPGAHPAGRGRALRHARRVRPDACTCRTRRSTCPATSPGGCRSSATYFDAHHVQLPLRQGRRGVLQPGAVPRGRAPTAPPTSRRMANLLQVSSAFGRAMETVDRERDVRGGLPGAARRKAERGGARLADRERDRGLRGGLRVPHQPRPRPARRRAGAAHPGGHPRPGRGGTLARGSWSRSGLVRPAADRRAERPARRLSADTSELDGTARRQGRPGQRRQPGRGRGHRPGRVHGRARPSRSPGGAASPARRWPPSSPRPGPRRCSCRPTSPTPAQAQASVARPWIAAFGRVDCLVNAAGLTTRGTLLDTTPELFDEHIAINLRAPFFAHAGGGGRHGRRARRPARSSTSSPRPRTAASRTSPRTSRPRPGWPG